MSKAHSPLLGYNNNVRHKNRVFHIQTEDSGVKHPHIITHLFMDGGRILKSVKRSYAEYIGADDMPDTVRQLMKDQHKAMFIALRDGQYDGLIESALGGAPPEAKEPRPRKSQRPAPEKTIPAPAPSTEDLVPSTDREQREQPGRALSDLPPPPAALFARGQATETRYRSQPGAEEHVGSGRPARASARPPGARPASRPPGKRQSAAPSDGRYAATRPASIFGSSRPAKNTSIFGEDLISDKSLDEVILSYLAEDLETDAKK
jgi:hypothetical protein